MKGSKLYGRFGEGFFMFRSISCPIFPSLPAEGKREVSCSYCKNILSNFQPCCIQSGTYGHGKICVGIQLRN